MQYDINDPPPPRAPSSIELGPAPPGPPAKKTPKEVPQAGIDRFWRQFHTRYPGKVTTILPNNPYARSKAAESPAGTVQGIKAVKSYNDAADQCKRDVERIARECRRVNQKYRDPHFDIELDLKMNYNNCLFGLAPCDRDTPKGVKRVTEIFDDPKFYIDKATSGDVRQGQDGDCWLMSALSALGTKDGLIDKVCVAQDEQVGIYGFVFYRDGEWQQCIIDDKLYLRTPNYDESVEERKVWNNIDRKADEEEYVKAWQTGSRALYFAACSDENETWLPLLEKAYAKLHGDYIATESGFVGEGIEDLTGGVTSELFTSDILDKDRFWEEEMSKVNDKFLFGCSTGHLANWLDPTRGAQFDKGIIRKHAYSIIDAKTVRGKRFVKLRNPWGMVEWTGAWSDGSKEWTPEWMQLLDHTFGDDGIFWMLYEDLLKRYSHFDRTRLFDESWTATQLWTTLHIPWSADYHSTKFSLTLNKKSGVVIVLSQLDTRYFKDFEGQYYFTLSFRIQKDGDDENDYIVRSHGNIAMKRSVSTDIELEAGVYSVLLKISASRDEDVMKPEDVIREYATLKPDKLIAVGLSYDLAHAKGKYVESKEEKQERKACEKREQEKARSKLREKTEAKMRKSYERQKKKAKRNKKAREKSDKVRGRRAAKVDVKFPDDASLGRLNEALRLPRAEMADGFNQERDQQSGGNEGSSDMPADSTSSKCGDTKNDVEREGERVAEQSSAGTDEPKAADLEADNVRDSGSSQVVDESQPRPASSSHDEPANSATRQPLVESLKSVIAQADSVGSQEDQGNSSRSENVSEQPAEVTATTEPKPKDVKDEVHPHVDHADPDSNVARDAEIDGKPVVTNLIALPTPAATPGVEILEPAGKFGETEDDESDDSFPDFDFDSELDMPGRVPSESGSSSPRSVIVLSDDSEGNSDPWNAVCVVGLRVYSQVKDADVTLKVVRPKNDDKSETKLDRDDPAKGLVKVEGKDIQTDEADQEEAPN